MCVDNLSKVALDSAAAGIEPATSSRKSNALTTARGTFSRKTANKKLTKLYIAYLYWPSRQWRKSLGDTSPPKKNVGWEVGNASCPHKYGGDYVAVTGCGSILNSAQSA